MKNNSTEIVFILDKSGSMAGMEGDTVGGFNATIAKQKKLDGQAYVTTVLFSDESHILHDRLPIGEVGTLTEAEYEVGGCTALLDAIGGMISHISDIHRYARPEDVPEHTIFIITTDGMENASRKYGSAEVKKMVEQKKKKDGWEFIFMAANIDAVETAKHIGIGREHASAYIQDEGGMAAEYSAMDNAISMMRCCGKVGGSWKKNLEEHNRSRARK